MLPLQGQKCWHQRQNDTRKHSLICWRGTLVSLGNQSTMFIWQADNTRVQMATLYLTQDLSSCNHAEKNHPWQQLLSMPFRKINQLEGTMNSDARMSHNPTWLPVCWTLQTSQLQQAGLSGLTNWCLHSLLGVISPVRATEEALEWWLMMPQLSSSASQVRHLYF